MPVLPLGRLDDGRARLQRPLRLEGFDHGGADTVLDAAQRIEEFQLGQDLALRLQFRGQPRQADQRGVADRVDDESKILPRPARLKRAAS